MAISYFSFPPGSSWQADGTTQGWWWGVGDRDNYWSISVRPFQANDRVRLLGDIDAVSDNNLNQTTEFATQMFASGGGGQLHWTAIRVTP
jgi:hypothetical protein